MIWACLKTGKKKRKRSAKGRSYTMGGFVQRPDDTNVLHADISNPFSTYTKATSCLVLSRMIPLNLQHVIQLTLLTAVSPQPYPALDENRIVSPNYAQLSILVMLSCLSSADIPISSHFSIKLNQETLLFALTFLREGLKSSAPHMHIFQSYYTDHLPVNQLFFLETPTGFPHWRYRGPVVVSRYRLGLPPDLRRDRSLAAGAQAALLVLRADGRLVRDFCYHRGGLPRAGALEAPGTCKERGERTNRIEWLVGGLEHEFYVSNNHPK